MNEQQAEMMSALLDGELGHEDQERVISALLTADSNQRERFGRYRLIGDVMRGESAVLASSVTARVSGALRQEPVVLAPPRRRSPAWVRPLAGMAVAASVAAAAIVVAPQLITQTSERPHPVQLAAESAGPAIAPTLVAAAPPAETGLLPDASRPEARWQALDRHLEDRLNRLVIEHQEFGGRTGINGPVPHIGFVSYDAR